MASGSIKKDSNGTWYYIVDVGTDANGKRKQKRRRGFKRKQDAQESLTSLLKELQDGEYLESSNIRLSDYMLEIWLEEKRKNNLMTRLTIDSYKSYIINHITPSIGKGELSSISAKHIKKLVTDLKEKRDENGKELLSDSTVQRIFNIVVTALNSAIKDGLIKENPAANVDRPKITKKKLKVWNVEEVNLFLNSLKDNRNYMAFFLAIHTGMRQGEILGLPISNIDFEKKLIRVTQTLEHDGKGIKQGAKTSAGIRSVQVSDEVLKEISKQIERIKQEKKLSGNMYIDNGLLICTNIGKPIFPDTLTKTMRRKIKQTGLNPIRFHDLRHTSASLMLMIGTHPKIVSERLGHSSVTITLDTYSHLLPNMQEEAANGLSNLLNKIDV